MTHLVVTHGCLSLDLLEVSSCKKEETLLPTIAKSLLVWSFWFLSIILYAISLTISCLCSVFYPSCSTSQQIGRPSLSLVLWEFSSCLKGAFPSHCVGVISYPREVFVWPVFQTVVRFECLFLFLLFKCATLQLSDSRRSESAQGCSAY